MASRSSESCERETAAEPLVARASALDDYLAGFAADVDGVSGAPGEVGDAGSPEEMLGLLDTMLLLRQAAAADGARPPAAEEAMPRSVGRHVIVRRAGEGGFATVWEAFDTQLRRRVAVKVRRPELLLSESARRRFIREAEIAARLVHPHIVTIFEVGEDAGREFIAAEFCTGGSLAAWLERQPGPLAPRPAARLVLALAAATAHAHAAGVIHRDIKPANVLLTTAAAGSEAILPIQEKTATPAVGLTVKLGDFGLGKVHDEQAELADPLTQLTRSGTSIGTPAWMAPEQIDRSFGPVGPATDVHALGLLLHRLLTGRTVRDGGTDAETYRQVLLEEPVAADQLIRGVPRDLAAVATKCLAKQPADRYTSAGELAADLERWLDGRPTLARPLWPVARIARWVRRRPVVAALGLAAVAGILATAWTAVERARDGRRLVERDDEIRRQRAVAELRRGFETLQAGNVTEAVGQLAAAKAIDPSLAASLAGRWLLHRVHGERAILLGQDPLATGGVAERPPQAPPDLYSIVLSPDGDAAAVAGADGRVHLLQGLAAGPGRGPSIRSIRCHDEVNALAFSRDGGLLATAGQDGRLRWWKVDSDGLALAGEAVLAVGPLYALAFSPDGRSLATGGEDRVVRLVPLAAPERPLELFRFDAPAGKSPEIESAVFVAEGLAVSCGDMIVVVDPGGRGLVREFQRPFEGNRNAVLGGLAVSPDGRQLVACGTDNAAHLWDLASGQMVRSLPPHPAWVQGCAFSPDGSHLATACRDGSVRVFEIATARQVNRLIGHLGRVWSIVWLPGMLLTSGADGTVRSWDPARGFEIAAVRELALPGDEIVAVASRSGAGERRPGTAAAVYAIDRGGGVREIDVATGTSRTIPVGDGRGVRQADLDDRRGRLVVCRSTAAGVAVVSTEGAAGLVEVAPPAGVDPAEAVACWTPSGQLCVRFRDGSLCWYPNDLRSCRRVATTDGVVHRLQAAPAGPNRVAAVGDRAVIYPLPAADATGGNADPPLVLPISRETTAVAWSPDGRVIAYGTRTGAVQLFDAPTGRLLGGLAPHEHKVEGLAFSPDGRMLLSADRHAVRISDAATFTTFDEIRPGIEIRGLYLAADAPWLALAGQTGDPGPTGGARLALVDLAR